MLKQCFPLRLTSLCVWPRLYRISILLLTFSFVGTTGCYKAKTYKGDGKMIVTRVGNWFINCTKYSLLLGTVDLAKKNVTAFKLQGLPHEEMTLSLEVGLVDRVPKIKDNETNALVRFELADEPGNRIVQEESHLNQMHWSYNGLEGYRHKASVYIGQNFKTRTQSRYTLTVEIVEPDTTARAYTAELVIWSFCG
jgi:hypothetical protein